MGGHVCVCKQQFSQPSPSEQQQRGEPVVTYIRVKGCTAPTANLLEGGGLKASLCSSCGRSNPEAMSVKAE